MDSNVNVSTDSPESYKHSSSNLAQSFQKYTPLKAKAEKAQSFLGLVRKKEDLLGFLECLFLSQSLKRKHPKLSASICIHSANTELAQSLGVFDKVYNLPSQAPLRKDIQKQKVDLLYISPKDKQAQLLSAFTGTRLRLCGLRKHSLTSLLGLYHIGSDRAHKKLERYGYNLSLEKDLPYINRKLKTPFPEAPKKQYIWFSFFEEHSLNSNWPLGYIVRLARLLGKKKIQLLMPAPHPPKGKGKSLSLYQKQLQTIKDASNIHVIQKALHPTARAAGMQGALAVVGSAGADLVLASLVRRPTIVLHDMQSHNPHRDALKPRKPNSYRHKQLSHYLHSPHIEQRHISPAVEECIENCMSCPYNSCVEYISPEQVFENLKKLLALA